MLPIFLYFVFQEKVFHLKRYPFHLEVFTVDARKLIEVPTQEFYIRVLQTLPSVENIVLNPEETSVISKSDLLKQHLLKERSISENNDIFSVQFTMFSDDTSANMSQKWNKVDVVYLRLSWKFFLLYEFTNSI
jgi:hypothetical protein